MFHNINTKKIKGRKYESINYIPKHSKEIRNKIDKSNLDKDNFNDKNSEKIMNIIYQIISEKKEEQKEQSSIKLLEEAISKIEKAKEQLNHRLSRPELDKKLEDINRLIKKFQKYLDHQGIE